MRVLFACIAHNTHFNSMVPLAWAFRAAGHEVRVAGQPALAPAVTQAGLTAVPVGENHHLHEQLAAQATVPGSVPEIDFTELLDGDRTYEDLLGLYVMLVPSLFAKLNNDSMVDELVGFARHWQPDLVVWEPLTWAGPVAATVCGAAHARLLWGADVLGRTRHEFLRALAEQPAEHRYDPLGEWLTWTLRRHGQSFTEAVTLGHWVIEQEPASLRLAVEQHSVPIRYLPYNGPAVVPDWLRESPRRTRICVTLGMSAREGLGRSTVSLADLVGALGDLDVEVVATLNGSQREALEAVPNNVRLVDYVPLHALLPGCSAVVHHGGAGTWSTALYSAVPQILVAEIWDAPLKARMLAEFGAGLAQPIDELTPESLRGKIIRVLGEPSFMDNARRLRDEMAAEAAPSDVVDELKRLTGKHRGGKKLVRS